MRGRWAGRLAVVAAAAALSGCSLTSGLANADGGSATDPTGSASASEAATLASNQDANAYSMVVRADLELLSGYAGSCQDLSEQSDCLANARVTPAEVNTTLSDLSHLPVPASLKADNAQLTLELHTLLATCQPVVSARTRDAEAEADTAYAFADMAVTTTLGTIEQAATSS